MERELDPEAIRKRKSGREGWAQRKTGLAALDAALQSEVLAEAEADIDALLAEVERLKMALWVEASDQKENPGFDWIK